MPRASSGEAPSAFLNHQGFGDPWGRKDVGLLASRKARVVAVGPLAGR